MARKNANAVRGARPHGYACHCPRCLKRRPPQPVGFGKQERRAA